MKRPLFLLPLVLPFLASCDKIKTVSNKLEELTSKESTGAAQTNPYVKPIGEADFSAFIAQPGTLNIVDYYADWCAPCKALTPILEEVVTANGSKARLGTFNVDQAKDFVRAQEVNGIPDVRFYINGKMVDRFVGGESKAGVEALIAKHTANLLPTGTLEAGTDNLEIPATTTEAIPPRPRAANTKPLEEAITPLAEEWQPAGMSPK